MQYFSDNFSQAKKTEVLAKITACRDEINKTIQELIDSNLAFEAEEEIFLAERERTEKEERLAAEEKRQLAEAAALVVATTKAAEAAVLATAKAAAAALNPPVQS